LCLIVVPRPPGKTPFAVKITIIIIIILGETLKNENVVDLDVNGRLEWI
jgi:hypothetical protein